MVMTKTKKSEWRIKYEMSLCIMTLLLKKNQDTLKKDKGTIGKLCSSSAAGKDNRQLSMLQLLQACTKARHSLSSHHRFYISLQAARALTNWQNIRKASLSRQTNLHISDTDAVQTDERYKWIHKHMYTHAFIGVLKHVGDHESTHAHFSWIIFSPVLPGSRVVTFSCFEPEKQ